MTFNGKKVTVDVSKWIKMDVNMAVLWSRQAKDRGGAVYASWQLIKLPDIDVRGEKSSMESLTHTYKHTQVYRAYAHTQGHICMHNYTQMCIPA